MARERIERLPIRIDRERELAARVVHEREIVAHEREQFSVAGGLRRIQCRMRGRERFLDFARFGVREAEIAQCDALLVDVAGFLERCDRALGLARAGCEIALIDRRAAEQALRQRAFGDAAFARLIERGLRGRLLRGGVDDFVLEPGQRDVCVAHAARVAGALRCVDRCLEQRARFCGQCLVALGPQRLRLGQRCDGGGAIAIRLRDRVLLPSSRSSSGTRDPAATARP